MSLNTNSGFTLIEVLIGIFLMGAIGVASTHFLYDVLSVNHKQQSIQTESAHLRLIVDQITSSIKSATTLHVPASDRLEIDGDPCKTFKYSITTQSLERADDPAITCNPVNFYPLHPDSLKITAFTLAPVAPHPTSVTITLTGFSHDAYGDHPFTYQTSVTTRKSL